MRGRCGAAAVLAVAGCTADYRATIHNETPQPVKVEVTFPYPSFEPFAGPRAFLAELAPGAIWDSNSAARSQVFQPPALGVSFVSVRRIGQLDESYVKQKLPDEGLHWDVRIREGEDGHPVLDARVIRPKRGT